MIACKSSQVFCSIRKTSISCLRLLLLGPSSNSTILIIRHSISLQVNIEIEFLLLTGHGGTLVACKVHILTPGQAELQGHLFSLDICMRYRRVSMTYCDVTLSRFIILKSSAKPSNRTQIPHTPLS